jgi:ABC-2 type transport system ATP-binding protein
MTALAEAVVERPIAELAIHTEDLTKAYGSLIAVDRLNLSVPEGSTYAIIGPNGAGKTTTFLILSTLLRPTSGSATVFGVSPEDDPLAVRRVLGYMPDFFGVYDDVRVSEYLDFFAAAYKIAPSVRKSIVPDLLELVDLSHKRDAFVESLSRGMKQRLGLARALIHDPRLLILDEPASGLDPRARVEFRELLLELRRMGKTVLISSHILTELGEVATDVGILEAGRLIAQGKPEEIIHGMDQRRAFTVRLLSDDAVDRCLAVLHAHDAVVEAEAEDGGCRFWTVGDDAVIADIHGHLARAGLPVVGFTEVRTGLEDLFMKVTKGIVQ